MFQSGPQKEALRQHQHAYRGRERKRSTKPRSLRTVPSPAVLTGVWGVVSRQVVEIQWCRS